MKATATKIRLQTNEDNQVELVLTLKERIIQVKNEIDGLRQITANNKALEVEISQIKRKRSTDANSYCWVLCQKIAEVLRATKEEVYQKAIREVGQFEIVPIKAEAAERWLKIWKGKGLGWFAEVMEESKLPGYVKIISYYGSSIYNAREMAVLTDNIIQEAKLLGIETMTPKEIASLVDRWDKKAS